MEALFFLVIALAAWAKFVWDTNPDVKIVIIRHKGEKR